MTEQAKKAVESRVHDALESMIGVYSDGHGMYYCEIDADYRDNLYDRAASELLLKDDPEIALEEKLYDWYMDSEVYYRQDIESAVIAEIKKDEITFPLGLPDSVVEFIGEYLRDILYFKYPVDHFMNQEFEVDVMLDTGDGNYDYVLNSVYPCWYGRMQDGIDDKAGIVWLAKQQGYKKSELRKELREGDVANPQTFLQSMRQELANLPSHMSTVTFLTKMTFRQLTAVNEAINWRDKQGTFYDARKAPQCGYIVLGKETMCGLYDPWAGGGSVLEVELERDVRIPIKYIRCALPDGGLWGNEYSIGSVYGLCGSAWRNTLKEISIPKKVRESVHG